MRQQRDMARAQDRLAQAALIFGAQPGDARGEHLARGGQEELEQLGVFIVDPPGRILVEGVDFAAATPVDASVFAASHNMPLKWSDNAGERGRRGYRWVNMLVELFDFLFHELDMLAHDGVEFFHAHLVRMFPLILFGGVEITGAGARDESDFFTHRSSPGRRSESQRRVNVDRIFHEGPPTRPDF